MTDITDQDKRDALAWAEGSMARGGADAAARYILATVDVPTSTLAEELMDWSHKVFLDEGGKQTMRDYSARAGQIEQERDDARAEVDRLTAERDREKTISKGWMEAHQKLAEHHAETLERDVQKGAESNAEAPNPADVKPGEAWLVEVNGKRGTALKDGGGLAPWSVVINGVFTSRCDEFITLVTRLVPAPRVITNPDELDRLAEGTIVRDKDGDAWRRTCAEWTTTADYGRFTSWAVSRSGPVTVLWEPGA